MPKYAHYNSKATQPTPVLGWYDTDNFEYPNLPNSSELIELDDATWKSRLDTPYVENGKLAPKPAPTDDELLDQAKASKLKEIEKSRDSASTQVVVVDTNAYDADPQSQINISAMAAAIANNVAPNPIIWRDANNINQTLSPNEFIKMATAVMTQVVTSYTHSFGLKDRVRSATTVAEVEAITWQSS